MGKSKLATAIVPRDQASATGTVTPITSGRKPRAASVQPIAEADDAAQAAAPATVVFGLDEGGKAHASWFGAADAELAIKAAGLMGFSVLPITTDEHRVAASGLAAGRVFASGRCFAPFAKTGAYEALKAFDEAYQPPAPPEPQPEPPLTVTGTPQRWEDLQVGSLVLATAGPGDGWYEAIIAEARGDAIFVLRWQGWADYDAFVRRADGLALLPAPPAAEAAAGE